MHYSKVKTPIMGGNQKLAVQRPHKFAALSPTSNTDFMVSRQLGVSATRWENSGRTSHATDSDFKSSLLPKIKGESYMPISQTLYNPTQLKIKELGDMRQFTSIRQTSIKKKRNVENSRDPLSPKM